MMCPGSSACFAFLVALWLMVPGHATGSQPWMCKWGRTYTDEAEKVLQRYNCDLVGQAAADFGYAQQRAHIKPEQIKVWENSTKAANALCEQSRAAVSEKRLSTAAEEAVKAWGQGIMQGTVCCTLVHPPYCLNTGGSGSSYLVFGLFAWLLIMFLGSLIASIFLRPENEESEPAAAAAEARPPAALTVGARGMAVAMQRELIEQWLGPSSGASVAPGTPPPSSLRVLPGAREFAESSSSLFAALQETFDFQADSARNQHIHLMSMWRSQCCNVADADIQEDADVHVDENKLLLEGLDWLHTDLMEGFTEWRAKFSDSIPERDTVPSMAGVRWVLVPAAVCRGDAGRAARASKQLAEIATYLLVWGEAGNVRFMPEVVYFVTELLLSAGANTTEGLYGGAGGAGQLPRGTPFQSGNFLAKVIRPIYNVVFEEWYDRIDVDPKSGKDKKVLRRGYEAFLPPDTANYDDWNEMFCDPSRASEGIVFEDGDQLFDVSHEQRFASLHRVDWAASLNRAFVKTHREVHSAWGFFASTNRIWLTHAALFFLGALIAAKDPDQVHMGHVPLFGGRVATRFAIIGLLVPFHAMLMAFSRYHTTGHATYDRHMGHEYWCKTACRIILWLSPLATYAYIRYLELKGVELSQNNDVKIGGAVAVHFALTALGFITHLGFPDRDYDAVFPLTRSPLHLLAVRYLFWFLVFSVKFLLALTVFNSIYKLFTNLNIVMLGHESVTEIKSAWSSTGWGKDVLEWMCLWGTTFYLFCVDTQLWFTVGCTLLGLAVSLSQRNCQVCELAFEDAIAKIPERFSEKVFCFAKGDVQLDRAGREVSMKRDFAGIWDRVLEYMRYEDKIDDQFMGDQSFSTDASGDLRGLSWESLQQPVRRRRAGAGPSGRADRGTPSDAPAGFKMKIPDFFRERNVCETFLAHYTPCVSESASWPDNPEVQWRYRAISRGLGLPVPPPYRAPWIPGITVLIPHYGESIIMLKDELYNGTEEELGLVPLMDWVKTRYEDEFTAFSTKMSAKRGTTRNWTQHGAQWSEYQDWQWDDICVWASMRLQTLWRTVAGMTLYHPALKCHFEVQGDKHCRLGSVWDPSDCFTCMVSMQMYKFFNSTQLQHTNKMFSKFPDILQVAFIDREDKNANAEMDKVHGRQQRRYFSSLIDGRCSQDAEGRRAARYKVELPGFPILGDGKSDNQNHAIIFMRGVFSQCIDANQGAYFEQMLMLPCVLGEFRREADFNDGAKKIIGLPEHITSDIGSIGDFAAGSEVAFGTILQRTYSVLGARMHYGHPDIMNKQFMMQQGGVSKATKTLNLSEDIFAGMDFTLRGQGRTIKHCEYFHVSKGRDLGFNTVLGFFSKLSSGAGEQIITRQMFRLHVLLHLPEAFAFYYAHVGYYVTQALVSGAMPILTFTWAVVLAADCEQTFRAFENYCPLSGKSAAEYMAQTLSVWYSWVLLLFLVATSMPLFAEVWMQRSFKTAICLLGKQYCTLSFLLFVFQAKIIGYYVVNELRYGGATYVATGRGLPTERRPFIGETQAGKMTKVGGLYLDYAALAYYDAISLLGTTILILLLGGATETNGHAGGLMFAWISIGLTIASWLYGPFVFNPYQFSLASVKEDARAWLGFFLEESGKHWVEWYDKMQLKPRKGFRDSVIGVDFFFKVFCLACWFAIVNHKLSLLSVIFSEYPLVDKLNMASLLPPIFMPLAYCVVVTIAESILSCPRVLAPPRRTRAGILEESTSSEDSGSDDEEAGEGADDAPAHARVLDTVIPRRRGEKAKPWCRLPDQIPLSTSGIIVVALQMMESVSPLTVLRGTSWTKAFVSGLVLKFLLFSLALFLAEGLLRSRCYERYGLVMQPISLWVHANRIFRDMAISAFIFITLLPFVLANTLNDMICPGFSLHQILIYRDPGHLARKEAVFTDWGDSSSDDAEGMPVDRFMTGGDGYARTTRLPHGGMLGLGSQAPPTTTFR
eukprot:TRINITY_DN23700_c0_g1_i1.p1 TRINITY_DN23700_c0_g1~~TRINITY_DN23700_c0_g1_i1.p1  ORF type:complete len:1961 (-),score=292.91 TRINITY_DN23700_c0_g1_i1:88-5970(-)